MTKMLKVRNGENTKAVDEQRAKSDDKLGSSVKQISRNAINSSSIDIPSTPNSRRSGQTSLHTQHARSHIAIKPLSAIGNF